MHEYTTTITWEREDATFTDNRYSRAHEWHFDGGTVVPASSSPLVVPLPMSSPEAVDPEEAFVAALSSCHMLLFLSFAARKGFVVERYEDRAIGRMGKNAEGRTAMLTVTLRPRIEWSDGNRPTSLEVEDLHHRSHLLCFLANSVRTEVEVLPEG